jgi:hypothetical protein
MTRGTLLLFAAASCACRSARHGDPSVVARMDRVKANVVAVAELSLAGLTADHGGRFAAVGPVPASQPWTGAAQNAKPPNNELPTRLLPDADGRLRERYEAVPCPDRMVFECIEIWATGLLDGSHDVRCVGLRLEKSHEVVSRRELAIHPVALCPFQRKAAPGEASLRLEEEKRLREAQKIRDEKIEDTKLRKRIENGDVRL